jgi:hypothetical protein
LIEALLRVPAGAAWNSAAQVEKTVKMDILLKKSLQKFIKSTNCQCRRGGGIMCMENFMETSNIIPREP